MLNKLSVKAKISAAFAVVLLILGVVSYISYSGIQELDHMSDAIEQTSERELLAKDLKVEVEKQIVGVRGFLLKGEDKLLAVYEDGKREFEKSLGEIEDLVQTDEGRAMLAKLRDLEREYNGITEKEIALRRAGKTQEAVALETEGRGIEVKSNLIEAIDDFYARQDSLHGEEVAEAKAA